MYVPQFFLFSLAYFDILYLTSILLREYKMSKRNLFEELKNGLKATTVMPKERTLVSVEEISSIRDIFKPKE